MEQMHHPAHDVGREFVGAFGATLFGNQSPQAVLFEGGTCSGQVKTDCCGVIKTDTVIRVKREIEEVSAMPEKRRIYGDEFKQDAIRLVTENGYGVGETARNLGINSKMLSRWKREAETKSNGALNGNGHVSSEQDELRRLREENKRLRMERDILKKTVVFLANESS